MCHEEDWSPVFIIHLCLSMVSSQVRQNIFLISNLGYVEGERGDVFWLGSVFFFCVCLFIMLVQMLYLMWDQVLRINHYYRPPIILLFSA